MHHALCIAGLLRRMRGSEIEYYDSIIVIFMCDNQVNKVRSCPNNAVISLNFYNFLQRIRHKNQCKVVLWETADDLA